MNERKPSIGIGIKLTYWVVMVLFIMIWMFVPDMGKDILKYEMLRHVIFLLLGVIMVVVLVLDLISHKRNDFEDMSLKGSIGSVLAALVTILILVMGMTNLADCVQDSKQGTVSITLSRTQIETKSSRTRSGRRSHYKTDVLKGKQGYEDYIFHITHGEFSTSVMNAINAEKPQITVVYYPNSKAIVQVQVHLEDKTVVLPTGDSLIETAGVENQDGDTSTKADTDATIEEDILYGVKIGDDYVTAMQTLMLNGYHYELVTPANVEIIQAEEEDIRTQYGIADSQDIKVLRNGNVELIVVYNDETKVIEDLIVDGERQ